MLSQFRTSCVVATIVAVSFVLIGPGRAEAHGEAPQLQQLLFDPSDPDVMVVVASFGLLITEDGGASWDWVCPEAISGGISLLGRGYLDTDGAVTLGLPEGIVRGEALGCDWSRPSAELDGVYVADVHADPADRSLALAITFEPEDSSRLFGTDDAGQTWIRRPAPLPARFIPQSVRAAPSEALSIYVSGIEPSGSTPFVFRSRGGGDVWERLALSGQPDEFAFLLLGVDPSDRDHVFLRAMEPARDRLAVSIDGAATFTDLSTLDAPALAAGRPFGFVIAPDGSVWVGNTVAGLLRVEGATLRSIRPELAVSCIEAEGDDLFICLDGRAGDGMAELFRAPGRDTSMLEPMMSYEQVSGVRACPAFPRVREICEPLLDDLRRHVALLPPLDAGSAPSDAGATDAGVVTDPPGGCGCGIRGGSAGGAWLLTLLALCLLRRPRR